MGRIRYDWYSNFVAINIFLSGASKMILDVSRVSPRYLFIDVFLELSKKFLKRLIQNINQGTQSASVSHADSDVLNSRSRSLGY